MLLFMPAPALAQSDQPAPLEIDGVTFSGSIRERLRRGTGFTPAAGQNLYGYLRHADALFVFAEETKH